MILTAMLAASFFNFTSRDLDQICKTAVDDARAKFIDKPFVTRDVEVAVAVLDRQNKSVVRGSANGDTVMYPASVVKAFYLAYAAWLRTNSHLEMTAEHQRAFTDMIQDSSNDATGLVLDLVTDTTGGPELPKKQMEEWMRKRQAVNRWLKKEGIQNVNACQKTWNEGPYGREKIGYGPNMELRNSATANSCVDLFAGIALGKFGNAENTNWMLDLLKRDQIKGDGQTKTFIGQVVPEGWEHHSKAGWAYEVRHAVAYLKGPDGSELVICIFTDHNVQNLQLLPYLASRVLDQMGITPRSYTD